MDQFRRRLWEVERRQRLLRIGTAELAARALAIGNGLREVETEETYRDDETAPPATFDYTVRALGCNASGNAGVTVEFKLSGATVATETTNASGYATLSGATQPAASYTATFSKTGYVTLGPQTVADGADYQLSVATGYLCFADCDDPFHQDGATATAGSYSATVAAAGTFTIVWSDTLHVGYANFPGNPTTRIQLDTQAGDAGDATKRATFSFTLSRDVATGDPKLTAQYASGNDAFLFFNAIRAPVPDLAGSASGLAADVAARSTAAIDSAYGCTSPKTVEFDFTGTILAEITGWTTISITEP